ncbi:MAG TPA: SDR family oxidoreductase [Planctomycetota bacterium]|nr:SDR family oxidoreductase [Planctomycetota bacterium]
MAEFFETYFGLKGRKALVTGAGRGIGRAIASGLAAAGAEVCIHYNKSREAADEAVSDITAAGGSAWSAGGDLTNSAQANALAEAVGARWKCLDILVNNAGDLVKRSPVADASDELIDQVIKVNIHTALYTTRACLPLLRLGQKPCIVNLGSIAAHNGGSNGATIYASTKGAIHTYTRGLARELAPQIRVNGIAPGVALTDFHRTHSKPEALEAIAVSTPLKRLGTAEDMIAATVFLCAAGAEFITGETIEINGGLWVA